MTNSSSQSYKELAIPYFKETFDIVDEVMSDHQVPYYLIGASVIDLELLKENVKPYRATKDIDFAIMISSVSQFEEIVISFEEKGFHKVVAPWTFYSKVYDVAIDILPYGEIEEDDRINFSKKYSDLHVLGFREVMDSSVQLQVEQRLVNVPPLPGMIVLKLVSWSDRPEDRQDDLPDILRIIEHYFSYNFDEIVEFHNDIFPEDDFDQRIIAAEVLGRKARSIIDKSAKLSERIHQVLDNNLDEISESEIAKTWARLRDWDVEYSFSLLKAFERGLIE